MVVVTYILPKILPWILFYSDVQLHFTIGEKHPYVAAFITSAATENASDLKDALGSAITEGRQFTEVLVLHEEDRIKFKHSEDAALVFQMLLLLGDGMVSRCENGIDYDGIMSELDSILKMLKRNFYKEEYLQ